MTLLALAAMSSATTTTTTTASGTTTTTTTASGTPTRPYNAPGFLTIPTPDESGESLHPSVVDMGAPWNGYRYWMAHTPYQNQSVQKENPCIVASHDGIAWVEPDGITNPIDPWPGSGKYNSDVELQYDPDEDRLICYWRDYQGGTSIPGNLIFCAADSADGVNWSTQQNLIHLTFPDSGGLFSPAVWRHGPGDWRVWFIAETGPTHMYTATDPLSDDWDGPYHCSFDGTDDGSVAGHWHGDVYRTSDGVYRFIMDAPYISSGSGGVIYGASSLDGLTWSDWAELLTYRHGQWDHRLYRPTMIQEAEAPAITRVWYSAYGATGDVRIGHTRIPLAEWPEPPEN